ncbi:MAG: hypothetical protein A2Z91_02115 [Deltaproteobacteria bacterium GWA2_38_16]|nr:MAG: hypothetical protein A2Z91_02115 [Deltaproteobacteria bacterium GWA2_38_16]OGQ01991.1 MAG: hypothetical protein A3D19_08410 [Deltaproteobacteria bacterium RIFCSPHIGHO2_02_FULL_38_15]OGQ33686.1 MAG: hypothetical protein A3A72_05675 [Deltaproteobacteria bacterium RIFCSPLOWO2_01_FULL_38_9]OGQ62864.1 MAG: hypothetical protein A3G92_02535 [Deltaproteobacteria bacterium RIFCSPLOWO2_12_FULL_38_8]HBQ21524.1 FAD-dependent oxidoreductase [Deltaproteobacteria bacterium]
MYDVIIIGGGVNGCGVARDCALRGLKTLLIEKKDLSSGTTGASSGMIHGGLRYLLHDVKTTKTSSLDSGYIQKIAPFLLFRIPFLYLIHKKGFHVELLETFFEVYDRYASLKNSKKHTRLSQQEVFQLEPGLSSSIQGALTFDEWGIDPYRLCILNAKDAKARGADLLLHTEVTDILVEEKIVRGVEVQTSDGKRHHHLGKIILNLSGPWIPKLCKKVGVEVKLRPGKGIHLVFDRRISNVALATETIDKRSIFLLPYQNTSILGTTDDDFYGDPDCLDVTQDEVEYLLEAIERVFPSIRNERMIGTYAGIRPTLYEWGKTEDSLSREHKIFDHEGEGIKGFITMAGGKLASYRLMSEELTDLVCKKLGIKEKCTTHVRPLPGGEKTISHAEIIEMAKEGGISAYALSRIYYRHGLGLKTILEMMKENPLWKRVICASEPVLEAEIRYAISQEWAGSISDIGRRTRLGWGGCQGADCVWPAALILKDVLGKDPHFQMADFLQKRWKALAPFLQGESIAQEELKQRLLGGFFES